MQIGVDKISEINLLTAYIESCQKTQ